MHLNWEFPIAHCLLPIALERIWRLHLNAEQLTLIASDESQLTCPNKFIEFMKKYQLIIFDFDGTLAITHQAIISCAIKTFEAFNITPPTAEEIKSTIGIPLASAFKRFHPIIQEEDLPRWVETYRSFYRTEAVFQLSLFPYTEEVIHFASSSGFNLVILSNKQTQFIESALEKFEINSCFKLIIGDDGETPLKPNPSVFYSKIQPMFPDIPNHQILVVGDSDVDLLFANNAGLDVCWAAYGYGDTTNCLSLNPTYVIDNLSQLIPIISNH